MPPYRADQVGSLLRPPALLRARADHAAGRLDAAALGEVEDRAILDALRMQRAVGLDVLTDGEYRRAGWMGDMLEAVEGFVPGGFRLAMRGPEGVRSSSSVVVIGRLHRRDRLTARETAFLRAHAGGPYKVTIPSPTNFAYLCFERGLTDQVYASPSELLADLVPIIRDEIRAAVAEGVPYVQIDAPRYTLHVDATLRDSLAAWGMNLEAALAESIAADQACLDGLSRETVTVAMHLCRGNAAGGGWFAGGGYDRIAEQLFGGLAVDRLLLEYDSERAGDFAPLRFVRPGTGVVLGLVTTKAPHLEHMEDLCRRIDEASRYVPLERLALSPQCGFASVAAGNPLTLDDQRRKLELVVETARAVWG